MSWNIIGDVAGQYKTLLVLLDKMPEGIPVSVGDMCDRGPQSKEVFEFFMKNGLAVLGNHDHFVMDAYNDYRHWGSARCWIRNGGFETVQSFAGGQLDPNTLTIEECGKIAKDLIPKEIGEWLNSLPKYLELDANSKGIKAFVSHAARSKGMTLEEQCDLNKPAKWSYDPIEASIIWNRGAMTRFEGYYQIIGHNSHWGLKHQSDSDGEFGICIDTSAQRVLTGIHWPSGVIYQQEYLD